MKIFEAMKRFRPLLQKRGKDCVELDSAPPVPGPEPGEEAAQTTTPTREALVQSGWLSVNGE